MDLGKFFKRGKGKHEASETPMYKVEFEAHTEDFKDADHDDYMRMSALSIQAAQNLATAKADNDGLLSCAEQWGRLSIVDKMIREDIDPHEFGFGGKSE